MQAQNRFTSLTARQITIGGVFLAAIAGIGVVLAQPTSRPEPLVVPLTTEIAAPVHQQAPDAQDRNAALITELNARWHNQSPDAQDRNQQLAK